MNKIDKSKSLLSKLVDIKDPITHERTNRYYYVLKCLESARMELEPIPIKSEVIAKPIKRGRTELEVTSSTYERAYKRLNKEIDNKFKNR